MWPWPRWQPPRPRLVWRKILVAVTLHCPGFSHVAAPVCLGASRQREGLLPGCHMQLKPSFFFTSEEQEQISRTASSLCLLFTVLGTLGSGSGLSCLFSFSIALAFLIELYLAFARQEEIFLYVFFSFVAIYKTLFYSATLHQLVAKWCRR